MIELVMGLLVLAAVVIAGLGILFLSGATAGVGLIALACLCAILARIAQAAYLHRVK